MKAVSVRISGGRGESRCPTRCCWSDAVDAERAAEAGVAEFVPQTTLLLIFDPPAGFERKAQNHFERPRRLRDLAYGRAGARKPGSSAGFRAPYGAQRRRLISGLRNGGFWSLPTVARRAMRQYWRKERNMKRSYGRLLLLRGLASGSNCLRCEVWMEIHFSRKSSNVGVKRNFRRD